MFGLITQPIYRSAIVNISMSRQSIDNTKHKLVINKRIVGAYKHTYVHK